jgi:hypothetical protein
VGYQLELSAHRQQWPDHIREASQDAPTHVGVEHVDQEIIDR